MDEKERIERFNKELDALLAGHPPGPSLPEAALRLARADFSRESRVRANLRRRLLARGPRGPLHRLLAAISLAPLPARVAAVAALLLAAATLLRRPAGPDLPEGPVTAGILFETGPADVFASVRPAEGDTPIAALPHEPLFSTTRGRETSREGRMLVVWETEDAVYVLERRTTSLEELFRRVEL